MAGFWKTYQLNSDESQLEVSLNVWEFAKYLPGREKGEWFRDVLDDYSLKANEDKIGFRKCLYHNTRVCMGVMRHVKSLPGKNSDVNPFMHIL